MWGIGPCIDAGGRLLRINARSRPQGEKLRETLNVWPVNSCSSSDHKSPFNLYSHSIGPSSSYRTGPEMSELWLVIVSFFKCMQGYIRWITLVEIRKAKSQNWKRTWQAWISVIGSCRNGMEWSRELFVEKEPKKKQGRGSKRTKTGKRRLLMVIYWMRRWGRSSDTGGTAPEVADTAKRRNHFRMLGGKKILSFKGSIKKIT